MREFVVYTGLRVILFAATWGIIIGLWVLVTGQADLFLTLILAFVISGAGSWFVLRRPRAAFARRVEARAERMTSSIDAMRSKEDDDRVVAEAASTEADRDNLEERT